MQKRSSAITANMREHEHHHQPVKRIWSMPWFNSAEPDDAHERRVWRVRVAILDAVMYDAT